MNGQQAQERKGLDLELSTRIILTVTTAFLAGAVACLKTGGDAPGGTKLLVAGAALSVGALVGFLFGVPRTASRAEGDNGPSGNTNLEQVSDWLTKILLGAGLVQLGAARTGLAALFDAVDPVFGTAVTAGAVLTYFTSLGFIAGWLFTRIFLGEALAEADRWTKTITALADEAQKRGDDDQAAALRSQALRRKVDPGEVWETIRSTVEPGPKRVALLDEHFAAPLTTEQEALDRTGVVRLFTEGDEGSRMEALRVMFHRPATVDLPCVVDAIERSRSGHEQFQALRVARKVADRLSDGEKATLRSVVEEAMRPGRWIAADSNRSAVAADVLAALDS